MKDKKQYTHLIWDWNGTLLDDVAWSVEVMNRMLTRRGMRPMDSVGDYHKVFCFPVIRYYRNLGLNIERETFEVIAQEFVALYYDTQKSHYSLHNDAEKVLRQLQQKEVSQVILSASEQNNLLAQVGEFEISHYFDEILGIHDVYATSKVQEGMQFIARSHAKDVLLVGDTQHDLEVAEALGADCVLVANGHQSKEALLECGVPVIGDLSQLMDYLNESAGQ